MPMQCKKGTKLAMQQAAAQPNQAPAIEGAFTCDDAMKTQVASQPKVRCPTSTKSARCASAAFQVTPLKSDTITACVAWQLRKPNNVGHTHMTHIMHPKSRGHQ